MNIRPLSDLAAGRICYCIYGCTWGKNGSQRTRQGGLCGYCRALNHASKRKKWLLPLSPTGKRKIYQRRRDRYFAVSVMNNHSPRNLPPAVIRAAVVRWEMAHQRPTPGVIISFLAERVTRYYFDGMSFHHAVRQARMIGGLP